MKKKIEIKPFTDDERRRIESGRNANELSILFFSLIYATLLFVFIYGIFKSLDDMLMIITLVLFIFGISMCLYYLIKVEISAIQKTNLLLKKNEKYCCEGYVNYKTTRIVNAGRTRFTTFHIGIDNIEYQISQKNYENIDLGDIVYYEVKEPLYTEVIKIDQNR